MALGGYNAGTWDNTVPAGSESVGLGENRIQSVKTTLQNALDSEHIWPSAGGVIGQHRAGSARAFWGPKSEVSASDTSAVANGRMMVTSDTSRLFSVNSLGPIMLGAGPRTPTIDSAMQEALAGDPISIPQTHRWAMEVGVVKSTASTKIVTFNSKFSGEPFLMVSMYTQPLGGGTDGFIWKLDSLTSSGFSGQIVGGSDGAAEAVCGIMWMSVGTRAV